MQVDVTLSYDKALLAMLRDMDRPLSVDEIGEMANKRFPNFIRSLRRLVVAGLVEQNGIMFVAVEDDREERDD